MTDNKELKDDTAAEEKMKGIGQEILGDLEIIGGMLTGDPGAITEGKFNAGVGEMQQESSEALEDK